MGSIRARKLRAFQGGANPLYKRRKRREMGKGMERQRQAVLTVSGFQQSGRILRLGVVDLERKRFCIFLPRGSKGRRKIYTGEIICGSSHENKLERLKCNQCEGQREETVRNLQKLEHCLVASWKSNTKEAEDLERLGRLWANSWGLKGKLGLAIVGTGCWVEEEIEKEVGVKILSLPILLWSPMILKKIGEECGGFVEIDEWTRTMGEIQWARLLVKTRGDFRPSVLEIEVEEEVYTLSLWWEIRPVVRRIFSKAENRRRNEVRGDMYSRAEKCVGKELVGARTEKLNLPDDGRFLQENGPGLEPGIQIHGPVHRDWAFSDGKVVGSSSLGPIMGLKEMEKDIGLAKINGPLGRNLKDKVKEAGDSEAGPSSRNRAVELGCHTLVEVEGLERVGPTAPQEKAGFLGRSSPEMDPFRRSL
ncbi:hypothetical protein CK203_049544 [Vitis vinifera]|uniref:Uncharacterized protein n=1 Tax=Vitis vinifera TaxID=29760 RepID=A0A438HBD4_VITVI|nr:hypothetical protein CK203_049544 [Vitis vinifera]